MDNRQQMGESSDAPKTEEQTINDTAPGIEVQVNSISAQEPEKQNTATDKKETYQEPHLEIAGAKKKTLILAKVCLVLSLIITLICGPGILIAALFTHPYSWVIAFLPQLLPFPIIITLAVLLSLVSLIITARATNKIDDASFKSKIFSRYLFSALFLLIPAMLCSAFSIPGLSILSVCIIDTILVLVFFAILILEKKNKYLIKGGIVITIIAIILFACELVLCGSWYHVVIKNRIEEHENEVQDEAERNGALQALRNPSIENELSDIAATHCHLEPFEIIYNDNKAEGIFKCKDGDTLFYAAYFGKNKNNQIQMSLFDLATIYNEKKYIHTFTVGENGKTAAIFFIDAENEALAYEKAKTLIVKTLYDRSFDHDRVYAVYAKDYKTFTDKDYLNAIFASGIYIPRDDYDCETLLDADDYECVEAKDDMFRRYIRDKNNYSSHSIDALFKNRHLFMVTYGDSSEAEVKEMFADATWNRPFTQGELAFKYISSKDYSPNDLDIVDDGSDDDEDDDEEEDDGDDDEDWEEE